MTQIISGHNLGLLDGSLGNTQRSDTTNNGSIANGVSAFVNVGNGNMVWQERDAYLPSLGPDFDLVRTYNSRGVIPGTFDGWSFSTAVKLETHNDILLDGKTQRNYTVTYGDQSMLHFDFDASGNRWVATDGSGAYEVLTELTGGGTSGPAFLVTRADQSQYRFDKGGALLSITDPNGVTMTFTYQGGKLRTVQDDSGHTITFVQSGNQLDRITKTSTTDNTVTTLVQFTYVNSQLVAVTDRSGHVTRYTYDGNGMLVGVSLPYQQTVNGVAQTWEQRNYTFGYERYYWDDKPHYITPFDQGYSYILRSMTDAMGGVTSFDYDFRFATTIDPADRDINYKPGGSREFQGGSARVVDSLGNARATSNDPEYVAWRTANGFYANYSTSVPQAQVDAIRNAQSVVYTFDANSQVTQVVDQLGQRTTYAYDARGNLVSTTDRNGWLAVTRDDQVAGDGYWRRQRVELGFADQPISFFTAQANWATAGGLQSQILARYTTTYAYDARGNQTSVTDGAGNRTTSTYTAFNKVASSTSPMGNALADLDTAELRAKRAELGFAGSGPVPGQLSGLTTAQRDALRALYTTSYTYDARQNLVRRTDPGGDVTNFQYDASGNLIRRDVVVPAINGNPAQTQTTLYSYDPYGNVRQVTDGEGFVSLQSFDTFGNLLAATDGRGGVTTYTYDADSRLLSTRTPEGRTTLNAYDAVGNRISITDFAGKTVTQVFDRNNMLLSTIDPALSDPTRTRTTTFQYDILGNRTRVTDAEGRITLYRFDAARRMVQVTTPSVTRTDGSTGTYATGWAYDGEGNVVTQVDNNGNTTQTQFSSIGLVRRITDATGNVSEFLYDANRQQIQIVIGAQLPVGQRRVLRYGYDEEDQRVASTDAIGGVRRLLLDAVGNVVAETDENGNQTRFTYDRNNRLVRETNADGTTVQHAFDGNGNEITTTDENGNLTRTYFDRDDRRVMVTDGNGINTVWEYDSRSNTTRVLIGAAATWNATTAKVVLGDLTQAQVESFGYDEFGDLRSQTDAVGWALANSDSAAAQQMRVEAGKSQLVAGLSATDKTAFLAQYTRRYTYDRVGNRVTETDALGRVTTWAWDGMDRLVSRTDAAGTSLARTTGFRWDGNDNQVRTVDAAGRVASYRYDAADQIVETTDALGVRTTFSYDNVGNKLSETRAAGTPDARTTTWSYDLADRRLTQTDPEGHLTSYQYDAVGNRTRVIDGRGNATQYVYDSRNRNVRIVDPLGGQTQMVYDGVGNQVRLIDPKGGIRETAFDAGNRTVQLTDAEGRITRYAYDVRDNVVTMTTAVGRPESQITSFVYDAENNLRAINDGEGRTSRLGYDAVYNETRSVDGNGNVTTTAYDALNRRILVTDPLGGQTAYTYDIVDNQLSETDALGRVRRWSYDANDRTTSMTDALGVRTDYAYDAVGNRVRVTEAANRPGQERTTQFFLDKDDRLVRQVDPLGGQTRYEYDANDNVTKITDPNGNPTTYAYDANNRVTSITDPQGGVTTYAYDANGNRTRVTDPRGARTTFYFNRNNEVARIVDPLGFVTVRSYDGNGNAVSETQFASAVAVPADPAAAPVDPAATPGSDRTRTWAYDKVNRVVRQTSALGFVSLMTYDAVGNRISDTDGLGRTTTYTYDANDRLVRTTNPGGGASTRTYDAVGNVLSDTDELNRTTRYTYDLENRLLTTQNPAGGLRSSTWDAVGNRLTDTDELGRVTAFAYDANDRLVARTDPAGGIARYTYDANGNRTTQIDELGRTTQFFYDAKDQLVRQVDPLNGEQRFAYDGAGNRIAETDELGRTRSTAYDLDGRVTAQTDALGNTRSFAYDAVDNLVAETDERGFTTRYGYDLDNRQTSRTDPLGATRRMAYDAVGNQIAMTDENGGTTTWQFDALDRMVRQTNPLGVSNFRTWTYDAVGNQLTETDENGHTTSFRYDTLDRVVERTDALGGRRGFSYDAVGNRLTDTNERGKTTTFTYDALDRQVTVTDPLGGVRSTTYDAVGNRTSETDERGKTTTFAYDANDRQTAQTDPQGGVRSQTYDAAGNVLTQTDENGQIVSFTYDGNNRVTRQSNPIGQIVSTWDPAGNKASETDENGNTTTFSYDGNNRLIEKKDPLNGTYRYGYDAKGNKTSETDENGNGATYRYDANDRVVEVVDGEGYRTTIAYDAAGNAVQRRQQLDLVDTSKVAVTTEKFDALDRSTETLTADGRLIRYEYDATGNVTKQTEHDKVYTIPTTPVVPPPDAGDNGRGTVFTYDDNGRQTSKTTPEGVVTTYQYDAAGNRTKETDGAGSGNEKSKDFGYDNNGRVTTETDALGTVTRWVLDARGNPLEKHEAYGTAAVRVTKWAYDGNNRVRTETDAEGYVTTFGYDAAGNMISRVRAGRTESFEYDKNRRLTAEVNGAGERTEYRYDGAGNRTEIRAGIVGGNPPLRIQRFEYDENDNLTAEVDGRGIRTEHRYDGAGNRIETIQNAGASDPAQRRSTTFAYDGDNRLVRVTNPEGGVTRYVYDTQGNQTEVVMPTGAVNRNTFDGNGRITVNIVDAGGAKGGIKTVNTYDVHGNVTSTTVSFGDGSDARTTRYTYDALNRQTSVTDGEGFTTTFSYDAFGNQTTIVTGQYLLASGDAGYDPAKAARAKPSRIDFTYDKLDRLVDTRQTTDNATGAADTLRATYDAFGNRLTQTTGFGTTGARTQTFAYDQANRLVRRDSQAGGVVILQYDAVGNQVRKLQLQSGTENTPSAVWIDQRFEYDGNGQLTAELNVLDGATTVRTNRILDAFGNEIETVVAAGTADERRTTFRYDRNNELIEKVEGAGTTYERRTRYQLDAAGRVIRETDPLGRATRLYYDGAGRHVGTLDPMGYYTQFLRDSGDNVVESRVYLQRYIDSTPAQYDLVAPSPAATDVPQTIVNTFDRVGNRIEQVQADGTRFTYAYDANRKLTSQTAYGTSDAARVAATANNASQTLQWRYDDALRMISFTSLDGTVETYGYDSSNNKISESAANPNTLVGGNADPVRTTLFVYDGENRLVEQRFDGNGLNLVDRLEYDKAGNVVRKTDRNGNATLSSYDRFNRVLTVTDPVGGVTTFGYDLVGNQVSITNSRGFRTDLSYDKLDQLLVQRLPAINAYTIDGGPQTNVRPETRLVYDLAGNVIQEVDENGGRTTRWFDANNNVIAEVSPDGALRTATFDANNNTLSTTLYMQKLPVAVHDTPAVQPSPPSGDQRTTTYAYDAGNRVVGATLPQVEVTTLSNFATGDNPSSSPSLVTLTKTNTYDRFGNLVTSVDEAGRRVWGWYDALGRQVAAVDAAGYLTESFYDAQGNIVRQLKYVTPLDTAALSPASRPTAPAGDVSRVDRVYDAANRLISETSGGVKTGTSNASSTFERVTTTFDYDANGNRIRRTLASGTPEQQVEYYWFDAANRQIAVVNPARTLHTFAYDIGGNQTEQKRYFNALPSSVSLPTATYTQLLAAVSPDAAKDQTTSFSFDALNRLLTQTQVVSGGASSNTYSSISSITEYDLIGNATRKTDGGGYQTRVAYDSLGNAIRTITPDDVTSFVEYNTAGEKVRAWTGVLGANGALAATGVSAAIDSQLRFSWTQSGSSDLQSFVVYDTQSRADSRLNGVAVESVYAKKSGTGDTGAVSIGVPLDGFAAGQTVYFRVVTVDPAGSQAWTEERTVVVPARPTALASTDIAGSNVRLTVTFNGGVTSPQLLYGATGVGSTANFTFVSGNTWRVDIPEADAGFYALRWTYADATYTTTATAFSATGPHVYDPVTKEASWTLPQPLADLQSNPGELVLIDGVRLTNGYTFNGEIHFKPNLATAANGTRTLDVLYGNDVATAHTASVTNVDNRPVTFSQVINRDGDNNITSIVRTYTYSHDYRTNVSVTLNPAETATVSGSMRVSWRLAGGGTQFTGDAPLSQSGNTFGGSLGLSPQTYDLKVYYFNSAGQEVVVEWQRVTVAATSLPGNVVVTDNTSPFVFDNITLPTAQPTTTATISYAASASLVVLARETGGSISRTGGANTPNISITAGRYSGPLGASVSSFALGLGSTAGSQGGQASSNGLLAASHFTEIEYNALGQKIASNEEEGLWRRFGLDAAGNRVVTRLFGTKAAEVAFEGGDNSLAPITTYAAFDARGNEITRFGAEIAVANDLSARQVTRMTYDYAGQMISRLEPGDTLAQTWAFDLAGNRIAETNALGQTTSYSYNRLGDAVAVTDPRGNTKRREYDAAGRMTAERDALGAATTYEYDAFGRVTRRTDPVGNVTQYLYDQRDRLTRVTDAANHSASYVYDARDNRTRETGFDGHTRTMVYDAMSRVTRQTTTSAIVSGGAQEGITTRYFYDAYGNRVREIDASGRSRYTTFGLTGRITSISDEGSRPTVFEYDRFGRQIAERGERGTSDKEILRSYNAAGWLTSIVDNGGDTNRPQTSYTYDIAGNRVAETVNTAFIFLQLTQRSMSYTYDALGRLTSWADAVTGLNLHYEWDSAGNRTRVYTVNLTGEKKRDNLYTYDAADRVTSVQAWNDTVGARLFSESYTYNAAGQRVRQIAGGNDFTYTYDALGRVTRAVETSNPSRTRATWSYDELGNVLSYFEYKSDGTKLREQTNTYFENGLTKTSFTETTEDVNDDDKKKKQTSTNEYDVSGRLIKQTLFDATDSDNELTYTYTFTYTADGRTLSISASGSNDSTGSSTSTYDVNDQLIKLDKGKGDDREGNELLTFTYDNDGKIITRLHDDGEDDTSTSPFTRFVYAGGEPVGETGTNVTGGTVTLLDQNGLSGDKQDMQYRALELIDKDHPGASTSTYNVRQGDSLQGIAASVYGNPSLWFLIADANGLKGDATLKAGQVLQVPTSIEPGRLNSDSHVLYRESDIIGSKLPNLQTPSSGKDNCALIGAIIALIFVAILAVVVTIVTVGIAAPAAVAALVGVGGAIGAAAATTLGTVIITVAVSAVIGAVVAAAASAISQGILIGAGLQKEWDWKQFAADVVVGFISGAVSGLGQALQVVKIASTVAKVANVVAQAALEAAGETARQAIANDGVIDNPWTILAAGVGGAFGALASRAVRTESQVRGKVGSLLTRQIKEIGEVGADGVRTVGKTQKVVVQAINPAELAKFGEGASVFKGATSKLVKTVDDAGKPILKQVERTATAAGKAQTILKLKDTKLVRIGNEVREVARVSSQFSIPQRIGRRLTSFASSALGAVKSIPTAIAGAGKAIVNAAGNAAKAVASGIREFGKSAAAAIRAVPDKLADAWESAKFVARVVGRAAKTKITNFVRSAATAVRSVGRDIAELPARIAQTASEAWASTKTAMKAARDALRDIAQTAGSAIKSLPGKIKQGASEIAQSFREWRKSGTVAKGQLTKTVRSFEDGPTGRVEKLQQVFRKSYLKKGYVTLAKTGNDLPAGSKLVRVGDEVQVWRRVSDQYSTGQRLSRWVSKNSVLKVFSSSEFTVDKTVVKASTTKIVRTGFARQFNEATQTFDEVARYATKPRLVSQGLDKTTQFVNAVKTAASATKEAFVNAGRTAADAVKAIGNGVVSGARAAGRGIVGGFNKAVDAASNAITKMRAWFANDFPSLARKTLLTLGDKISNAHPFTKWRMVALGVTIGKSVATGALRDYKDDRAGGPISTLVTAGKGIALAALKRPREQLNDWLLNQSRNGFAKDDESLQLKISSIRKGLYGLERSRGWFPFQWIATGTNVFSRVQSPIDLDFNQTYEQRLRTSRLSSGETASFEPRSVFDFAADLDGRINDQKIPLLSLSNLPPLPRPAFGG